MSSEKKKVREIFRQSVFKRDGYKCRVCSKVPNENEQKLDAHHIINRENIINQGYVAENGVSLCEQCHIKAEEYYKTGIPIDGYSPEELYDLIDSSYEKAYEASLKLK